MELAPRAIPVNIVTPGLIDSGFAGASETRDRAADPAEIARTVPWLAGSAASYITGTEIVVDVGLSLRPMD